MADYSFIAGNGLQQTPYDPLKMVTNLQSLQNMQTENQLNQQGLLNRQQELKNLELTNQTGQQDLAGKRLGVLSGVSYGMLLSTQDHPEMLTPDFVHQKVEAIGQHFPGLADDVKRFESTISPDDTPDTIRQKLQNVTFAGVGPVNSAALAGKQGMINTGGAQVGYNQPGMGMPNAGQIMTQGKGVPLTLTPEQGYQVSTVRLPDGRTVTGTMYQHIANGYFSTNGQPAPGVTQDVHPGATPAAPMAATPTTAAPATPTTEAAAPTAATPTTAAAPATPVRGIVQPPGNVGQQDVDQDLYHKQTQQYNNNDANLIANYKEAYTLGQNLATGSATTPFANIAERIVALGRAFGVTVGPLNDKVQARAELDKVLNQILTTSPGAGRSDAALGTAQAGQPHMGMDTAAMLNQIRILYGQTKQKHAAMLSLDANKNGTGYQAADREMMQNTSREGFAADLMTKAEAQERLRLLGGKDTTAGAAFARGMGRNNAIYKAAPGSSLITESPR